MYVTMPDHKFSISGGFELHFLCQTFYCNKTKEIQIT